MPKRAPPPAPMVEERYSGKEVVKQAMRECNLAMRNDVSTDFRYAALGHCAGLVSANAHRLLTLAPTRCDLVAEDSGALVVYEVAGGCTAKHVVSTRSMCDSRAPCRRHSGSLCEVITQTHLDVVYMTEATMPSACGPDAAADDAEQTPSASPAISLRKPRFFVVVTPHKHKFGGVTDYHQVTAHVKHADVLSPIDGGTYVTLGTRGGPQEANRIMDLIKSMVTKCGTGVRSMTKNLKGTHQQKRSAPRPVNFDERAKYYKAMQEVTNAAEAVKITLNIVADESERPSAALRLTSLCGNEKALALADAYEKLPLTGEDTGSHERRFADVGKPFKRTHVRDTDTLPELSKGSIPVSYKCLMPVSGNDIGFCKGLRFDKKSGKHFSASDSLDAACAAPSAVVLAFVTAAIATETGHIARR